MIIMEAIKSVVNGAIVDANKFCYEYNRSILNNQLRQFLDACFSLKDGKYQVENDTDTVFSDSEPVIDPENKYYIDCIEIVSEDKQDTTSTFVLSSNVDGYIIERELFRTDSFCSWSSSFMFAISWKLSKFDGEISELDESDKDDLDVLSEIKDDLIESLREFSFPLSDSIFSFPEKLITKWENTPACDLVEAIYKDVEDLCNDNVSYK